MKEHDEIFKPILGYEDTYLISNKGNIKSLERKIKRKNHSFNNKEIIIKNHISKNGYEYCKLHKNKKQKSYYVHRLVAENFIPNPHKKRTVNHINGIKTDNNISNLEWMSYSENHKHAFKLGLKKSKIGEEVWCSKLRNSDVLEIKWLLAEGCLSQSEISKMFNVSKSIICSIHNKKTWKVVV